MTAPETEQSVKLARLALGVTVGGILALTTFPTHDPGPRSCIAALICGQRGGADIITNVLLFLPLGWALRGSKLIRPSWGLVLLPAALSVGIEALQHWIPGRHSSPGDVVFNTIGAGIGAFAMIPLVRAIGARRGSDGAALTWAACIGLTLTITGFLLQTAFPHGSVYFGQWTPTLGGMASYAGGNVLSAEIDGEAMPSFALASTRIVLTGLERGDPVVVRFVVAPEPAGLAPVFAIADRDRIGVLLFGILPGRMVVTLRTKADAYRLSSPNHEIPLPAPVRAVGDTVTVAFRRPDGVGRLTFAVNGTDVGSSRWTVARGWAVLYHRLSWDSSVKRTLDALWIAVWFAPLGFFWRPSVWAVVSVIGALGAVSGIGAAAGLAALPAAGWLAAGVGLTVGLLGQTLAARVRYPR